MNIFMEETLTSKVRNSLEDNQFGLPDSRKYPLNDEEHVRSAISYFFKCPEKDRYELAINIQNAANKFNIDIGKDTEVSKYLNMITEESWNSYVIEMTYAINYSDSKIVMEQSKSEGFFDIIRKAISNGLRSIGKAIMTMASWLWDKIQKIAKKILKNGPEYIKVPKIFKNLKNALPLADAVAKDVSAACYMLTKDLKSITETIDDKKVIIALSKKSESWRMTMLSFMKNSGLCYQQTNLSVGDSAVQNTITVNQNEINQMIQKANITVQSLNASAKEVIKSAKNIDEVGDQIKRNYNFFQKNVRKAFGEYATSGKELISEALKAINMTSESIQKVVNLTNIAIVKQMTPEDNN